MSPFRFCSLDGRDIAPQEWLRVWSIRYTGYDDDEYYDLIAKGAMLERRDYERVGRWKDNAKTDGRWKPNVAMVAYEIWMQAASELPRCPHEARVAEFLDDWSKRAYANRYESGQVQERRFGLSRATTLLHFVSEGRYPIFDSRVRKAIFRLLKSPSRNTVRWYLDSYCRIFSEIAAACGTRDLRTVDKALFCFGDRKLQTR